VSILDETGFELFLIEDEGIDSKSKAVASRMSRARAVEKEFDMSLDSIVQSEVTMYNTLVGINRKMANGSGAYSNALRKYYIFKNNCVFPKLDHFERDNRHLI